MKSGQPSNKALLAHTLHATPSRIWMTKEMKKTYRWLEFFAMNERMDMVRQEKIDAKRKMIDETD